MKTYANGVKAKNINELAEAKNLAIENGMWDAQGWKCFFPWRIKRNLPGRVLHRMIVGDYEYFTIETQMCEWNPIHGRVSHTAKEIHGYYMRIK